MKINAKGIEDLDRIFRLNLINSITGIKPANLIGTRASTGENLAIFSSVLHMGSNPPLLAFNMRPNPEDRDTLGNIQESGYFTINSIPLDLIENAHYTSAKFDSNVNEFQRCNIQSEYIDDFNAPFVKGSPIKIGLKAEQFIPIELNETQIIIGSVQLLSVEDSILSKEGYLNLEKAKIAGISGLNSYYSLKKENQFPYVRTEEVPDFD